MTIQAAIDLIDSLKPNMFEDQQKIAWLSELDGMIWREVIKTHEGYPVGIDFTGYDQDTEMDTVLLAPPPYSDVYKHWLASRMDIANRDNNEYSDNKGNGSNTASYVTETTDYLWLPAEYEVFGSRSKANSAEQNHQKQYDYYASGNSRIMYQHNATSTAVFWWLRSVLVGQTGSFCDVSTAGAAHSTPAQYSYGIAPCFCV